MKRIIVTLAVVAFLIGTARGSFAQDSAPTVSNPATAALVGQLLDGRWETVFATTTAEHSSAGVPEPITRFLAAHAALATNRDNEALVLFLSLRQTTDQKACLAWTQKLADAHPDQAIALYLAADALARSGNLTDAETKFASSLKADPNLALAWLARGVMRSVMGHAVGEGDQDIEQAAKLAPKLADALASLGCLELRDENADEAERLFNKALDINSRFALALNGRGCARYGSGTGTEQASLDFEEAKQLCPILLCAETNQSFVHLRIEQKVAEQVRLAAKAPGASITGTVSPINPSNSPAGISSSEPIENLPLQKLIDMAGSPQNAIVALNSRRAFLEADSSRSLMTMDSDLKVINWANRLATATGWAELGLAAAATTIKSPQSALSAALAVAVLPYVHNDFATAAEIGHTEVDTLRMNVVADNNRIRSANTQIQMLQQPSSTRPTTLPSMPAMIVPNSLPIERVHEVALSMAQSVAGAVGGRQVVDVVGSLNSPRGAAMEFALNAYNVPHVWTPTAIQGYGSFVSMQDPDRIGVTHQQVLDLSHMVAGAVGGPNSPSVLPFTPKPASFTPNWTLFNPPSFNPLKGVSMNLQGTYIDNGNWPVMSFFTLAYWPPNRKSKEH